MNSTPRRRSRSAPSPGEQEEGEERSAEGIWHRLRIADGTLDDRSIASSTSMAIVVRDGSIAWIGAEAELPRGFDAMPRHDGGDALVTPGLVDCHTHLVYGGDRAHELSL